jgi:hypothetical protein
MDTPEFMAMERDLNVPVAARGTPRYGKKYCDVVQLKEDNAKRRANREIAVQQHPIIRHDEICDYGSTMINSMAP